MKRRKDILNEFYGQYDEENRLIRTRHGQLESATTMHYIEKFAFKNANIIELGAGTGRYSIELANKGYNVTAVELVEKNLSILKEKSNGITNLKVHQGDAVNLSMFEDNSFDITLSFGPFYHLYNNKDITKAIDEAIRITKPGGIIMCAFLSIYAIMDSNYMYGRWNEGLKENYNSKFNVLHFQDQLFTGYDICEFEKLFANKNVDNVATVGLDGSVESLENRPDFNFSDEQFKSYINWHIHFAETRELLGKNNHLLYICKKNSI